MRITQLSTQFKFQSKQGRRWLALLLVAGVLSYAGWRVQAGRGSYERNMLSTPTVTAKSSMAMSSGVTALGVPSSQYMASSTLSSFTVDAGMDRLLVVAAGDPGSPTNPTGVAFNGMAMSLGNGTTDGSYSNDSIWYLKLGSGAVITGNVVVSFAGTDNRFIGAAAYSGVDQMTPVDINGPDISGSITGTNLRSSLDVASQTGDLVFDLMDTFLNGSVTTVTTGPGQTRIHDQGGAIPVSGGFGHYTTSTERGAPNVTMSWASNAGAILHLTMNINAAPVTQTLSFAAATNTAIGADPLFVLVSDFNADGNQDVAVALSTGASNNVKVLLGNGSGGFSSTTTLTAGTLVTALATGDFNGDGKEDLVASNSTTNNVSVFLGNGLGGFGGATNFAAGVGPESVTVGDMNKDGKPDLLVSNAAGTSVSLLLGNGSGGFAAATDVSMGAGSFPYAEAVGDFNGDGKLDLAAVFTNTGVGVRLGDGLGGFGALTTFSTGTGSTAPTDIVARDVTGDGKIDLVIANNGQNNAALLVGNGLGSFAAPTLITLSGATANPWTVVLDDFNGDGKDDLATANTAIPNVGVLLGNGAGVFSSMTGYTAGTPYGLASGDLNNDGKADLITADYVTSGVLKVLLNTSAPVVTTTTVSSINRAGASPVCSGTSVSWTVTFAASVSGLTASNFTLANTGLTGPMITGVSGSGTIWTVTASTGTGGGSLGLDMANSTGVTPTVTNVPLTGQVFTVNAPPTTATVGGPQTICALGTTASLGGNMPTTGTGMWSVVSGGTGSFSPNATTPNATFTHATGTGPVVVRWTISNGVCTPSTADVTITINQPPTTATVGGPQTICELGTTTGLGGNTPVNGTRPRKIAFAKPAIQTDFSARSGLPAPRFCPTKVAAAFAIPHDGRMVTTMMRMATV